MPSRGKCLTAGPAEEEVMKANALMRFVLSGNRSLEEFAVLLARISLGVFFAISGGNKLFVASQNKLMYETIVGAGIPFPHVMTYFVSSVEFVCGCVLIIGLLSTLCCMAFIIDMIVAITTVQLASITKALSFIDWLDDLLYLPEVLYIIIFLWLISSGPGRLSVDHWIAVRSGLLDGVSADQRDTQAAAEDDLLCQRSLLTGQRARPAGSVGVGLAHRIAQNNERRATVTLASSGSISNSKPSSWHIFNIVLFSCSVRPSMTRSPTLRAYSIINCISIQLNP
jgi:putative oxidoreductase